MPYTRNQETGEREHMPYRTGEMLRHVYTIGKVAVVRFTGGEASPGYDVRSKGGRVFHASEMELV